MRPPRAAARRGDGQRREIPGTGNANASAGRPQGQTSNSWRNVAAGTRDERVASDDAVMADRTSGKEIGADEDKPRERRKKQEGDGKGAAAGKKEKGRCFTWSI